MMPELGPELSLKESQSFSLELYDCFYDCSIV
jgi:hypothetical protein